MQPSAAPERRIGRFRLDAKLGSGGMGDVYAATDTQLRRTVALKLLPARFASEPDRLSRFEIEARAASALNHPNIVTVYDAGVTDGTPWIAMERVEGRTLRAMLGDGALPAAEAQRITSQVATGLARAHEAGIVHRDLKPENVMVRHDGLVKILDFGVAKLSGGSEPQLGDTEAETALMTMPGSVSGTPAYMSPEQATAGSVDHRSDQFALGILLYEMITGENPFRRQSVAQTLSAVLEFSPQPLKKARPEVPTRLSEAVERCLAKDPAARFGSASEVVAALESVSYPAVIRPYPRLVASGLVLVALAAAVLWFRGRPQPPSAPLVAVRSFQYLSSDPTREYLSGGLSEEIRSHLSRVSAIRLLSRSAVDRYPDQDVRKLASELGAEQIVEGTVRVEAGRIRVSVQLTDARTAQTRWSNQYDRAIGDVLALQGELALQIADAMQTALTPDERRHIQAPPTANVEAYDLFLRAAKLQNLTNPDNNAKAIELLRRAVSMDPRFAAAMAAIAERLPFLNEPGGLDEAETWAERALKAAPDSPRALSARAVLYSRRGMSSKARSAGLRTLELDPNDIKAMNNLGAELANSGQVEEALHWARLSLQRDPTNPATYYHVAVPLLLADRAAFERWMAVWQQRYTFRLPLMRIAYQVERGSLREALDDARKLFTSNPKIWRLNSRWLTLPQLMKPPTPNN